MNYYLGIDGGGTKTSVHVIDQQENIIYQHTSGPSSIDTVTHDETLNAFKEALAMFAKDHPNITFSGVFVGLGGIVSREDEITVEGIAKLLPGVTKTTRVSARNDMENALYSGLLFDEGIALICGTGMVAFGKSKEGLTHKAGGWSFKEGDLGSSYDLGMRALKYVIQAYDGREEMSNFAQDIAATIGMTSPVDFFHIIQDRYLDRTWIAGLAPLVTKHHLLGDSHAKHMVKEATKELAKAVDAVYRRLHLEKPVLVVIGSLGQAKGYQNDLHEALQARIPKIEIIRPKVEPSLAAALMAKRLT